MSVKLRTKKLKDGSESFYLDIYYKGKRNYEFLNLIYKKSDPNRRQIKELAEKIKSKKELEFHHSAHNIPNYNNSDQDLLKYYLSKCKDYSYISSLNKLKEFSEKKLINDTLPFNRVDKKFCEDYKEWLLKQVSNNTAENYFLRLKAVINKAIKDDIIPYNPAKFIMLRREETEKIYLTFEEVQKLKNTEYKKPEICRAFLFSCFTGLRISDIKALTWQNIRDGKIFFKQRKTRGIEYLPLGEAAKKILYSNLEDNIIPLPDMKVFKLNVGKSQNIGYHLREWAKKAKVFNKHITFHTARHTFATISLTYGIDLYTVSKMLGHKNISATQIYAKIVNEKVNEEIKKLPIL